MTHAEANVLESVAAGWVKRSEAGMVLGATQHIVHRLEALELVEWMGPSKDSPGRYGPMRLTDAGRDTLDALEARGTRR